jgi:hypothetical protein
VISEVALAFTLAGTLMLVTYSTSVKAIRLYRKENNERVKKPTDIEMKANPTGNNIEAHT